MRVLGLDIGEKRVGVAVSDPSGRVATPLRVSDARGLATDPGALRRIVEDYEIRGLVVGLPLGLSGEEGPQAAIVRAAADRLGAVLGLPVAFIDERLSTTQARRSMRDAGRSVPEMRGAVDMVAAAILLQTHLDATAAAQDGRDS
jgi:putative Holliday junction resolvase